MAKSVRNIAMVLILPLLLFVFFSFTADGFGLHSASILISQSMIPVTMGFSMAFIMTAGMFDLSSGARVVFAATIGALLEPAFGFAGVFLGCIAGGLIGGAILGVAYRLLRIPSMVISLGAVLILEVVAVKIAGNTGHLRIANATAALGSYPVNIFIAVGAGIIFYLFMYKMKLGCMVQAIGNDEVMAQSMGIKTDMTKFQAYLVSGFFCGVCALLTLCYSASITLTTNMSTMTMVFQPMIGVLIGMQLMRFVDNLPLLVFIGELCISIIFNGFIAMGFTDKSQKMVLGIFLIVVMAISAGQIRLPGRKGKRVIALSH